MSQELPSDKLPSAPRPRTGVWYGFGQEWGAAQRPGGGPGAAKSAEEFANDGVAARCSMHHMQSFSCVGLFIPAYYNPHQAPDRQIP
jgi:hypothetical protein